MGCIKTIKAFARVLKENKSIVTKIPDIKKVKGIAPFSDKLFMPQRLNLILRMEGDLSQQARDILDASTSYDGRLIDTTYEVQLRTVFSEGWHEVEHDIRYKTRRQDWWNKCENESRLLNGIYASLESSEHSMSRIVSDIAKVCYDSKEWDAMIRNHFKLRFGPAILSNNIATAITHDEQLSEHLFFTSREDLIKLLIKIPSPFSLTTDYVVCLLNRHLWKNKEIYDNELSAVKASLDRFISM